MKVHHEGRGFLTILFFVLIVLNAGIIYLAPIPELIKYIVGGVSVAVFLFFLQFFRNPTRKGESKEEYRKRLEAALLSGLATRRELKKTKKSALAVSVVAGVEHDKETGDFVISYNL